jgi:plasmid replication initiation protein
LFKIQLGFVMKETNQIVKKSNDLITAKYRLTIIQQYVLHNVISQIHIEDTDFKKYEVNVRSIAENHGIDTKNAYRYIKKSALELNKQPIIIGDEIEGIALNWFSSVRYNSNRGTLLVDFHPDLKPYLLQLQSYFTQYENKNIQQFKCVHSLRFYEFLKQKQNLGKGKEFYIELTLAEIRSMFCFSDTEYKANKDLRVYVIEPALKEINEQTDLSIVDTQFLKKGRSINSIYITAKPKTTSKTAKKADSSDSKQKTVEIPTNIAKQPENANLSVLQHRASKITGLIMSNRLSDRFKQGDESIMQMMARIQSEITTDEIADQWQNKLEEFGVIFS